MTPIEQWNAERRHAWDMYVVAYAQIANYEKAGWLEAIKKGADTLLTERDLKFPKPKEV